MDERIYGPVARGFGIALPVLNALVARWKEAGGEG